MAETSTYNYLFTTILANEAFQIEIQISQSKSVSVNLMCIEEIKSIYILLLGFRFIVILISLVLCPGEKVGTARVAPDALVFKQLIGITSKGKR